jgi:hypothetical protein
MKRLLLILFLPTLLLADIDRVNEETSLPYWPDYILSGDPNELDEYFRILVQTLQDIQDEIITTVNLGVDLDDTDVRYFGTQDSSGNYANGDWRIIKVGADDFEIQKRISGTWTVQMKWSVASGTESTGNVTAPEFTDSSTSGTSTEWEDSYNKRVDTWTAPLSWSSNVASLAVASAYIIVGNASGVGVAVAMSGDVLISNAGVMTIQPDSVALTTDTTGNYVASVTNGTSITGGDGGSEGAALTLDVADDSINGTELADTITIDGTELDLSGDVEITGQLKLSTSDPPSSAAATGETGDIQWGVDSGTYYAYICVAANTWRRVALATFGQENVIYAGENVVYAGEQVVYP